ncbi:MAG: HAD family phosphatase [Ginsengibacter sp.]
MKKIDAVIFDLGGVLLDIDYNRTEKAFEKLGVANFNEMYSQASADRLFQNLETGNITEPNFYKEFNNFTGLSLSVEEIINAWNSMLLTFRETSLLFLNDIKSRYKLFLLSNTNQIHYNKFNKIYHEKKRAKAFENYFDKAYYSFEMGMRKPDRECYEYVLLTNNLTPRNTLFIDDSAQNINAARNLGMQTILLETGKYIETLSL